MVGSAFRAATIMLTNGFGIVLSWRGLERALDVYIEAEMVAART
jgi:hypothetical protein